MRLVLGNHINIHYKIKKKRDGGWAHAQAPNALASSKKRDEWSGNCQRAGGWAALRRSSSGSWSTSPNWFSKDLFLSSTPHPEGLAVILVGRVGAASTSAPTELPQLFFMEENTSIDQNVRMIWSIIWYNKRTTNSPWKSKPRVSFLSSWL